ncbi:class I SAM-dependent rRNA methyltransferase [Pseudomaricurvus alkylphenolicus]|uniref:class I SAM-dependent rRNA methyltransferase n=1 Tax=Pseudomaricurvus alkylphenolicus TaxID=1306991 RepID=UPI0014232775|nr:class I SAM-dependent rRNA methyltransferase [Pseudomaricurvus alkylphenolicus]NIB42799.1 class I SAM-dependent rRNA methyltransferase [Pseudomaricurvus alkylphenolicus]
MADNASQLPKLVLKSQADRRLKRGHLWIYSNEVDIKASPLKAFQPGEQALVCAQGGKPLAIATLNPGGLICARVINRDTAHPLDKSLLVHRLKQALALRQACFEDDFYRLVYGDSDLLPGLVVDRFGEYLVVQMATAGMEAQKEAIVEALQQVLKPAGILLRNDHTARSLEGLDAYVETVGDVPEAVELVENGVRLLAPIADGQKTGWFYDHRENRRLLQRLAPGKRVLDVFSYAGGWGVQAAVAGASEVVCVDASEQALQWVGENAHINGVEERMQGIHGKAVHVLKDLVARGEQFDIVVLDPPAFIKRKKDQKSGEAAYRHINELGMRLLARDGLLVSASCSMHLERSTLVEIVRGAARHLDRHAQIIHQGGQGADHPVHPAIPETDYLKAVFARVYLP